MSRVYSKMQDAGLMVIAVNIVVHRLWLSRGDVQSVLKDSTRVITGNRSKFRQALIVVEVALTLVLLVGAILLLRSFYLLQQVNAGFNPDNVLSFRISLPDRKYDRNE